ncbi:MAG: hypothetical protein HQ593_06775, partial [Candidatus Omnitrophica bacterium]|nr:hypothetical protein [Candidatus Omnitrophota bacterium]
MIDWQEHPQKRICLKIIAMILAVIFFYQQIVWAAGLEDILSRRKAAKEAMAFAPGYVQEAQERQQEVVDNMNMLEDLIEQGDERLKRKLEEGEEDEDKLLEQLESQRSRARRSGGETTGKRVPYDEIADGLTDEEEEDAWEEMEDYWEDKDDKTFFEWIEEIMATTGLVNLPGGGAAHYKYNEMNEPVLDYTISIGPNGEIIYSIYDETDDGHTTITQRRDSLEGPIVAIITKFDGYDEVITFNVSGGVSSAYRQFEIEIVNDNGTPGDTSDDFVETAIRTEIYTNSDFSEVASITDRVDDAQITESGLTYTGVRITYKKADGTVLASTEEFTYDQINYHSQTGLEGTRIVYKDANGIVASKVDILTDQEITYGGNTYVGKITIYRKADETITASAENFDCDDIT